MIERTVEIDDAIAPTSSFVQQRHVPPELIHAIISFIPSFDDRLSISLVCRTWAEVVLPRVYRCVRLHPYDHEQKTIVDDRGLLQRTKQASSFMRSCVKELNLQIAASSMWTPEILIDILDLFPQLQILNYDAARSHLYDPYEVITSQIRAPSNATPVLPLPRLSLFTLRLQCEVNELKFKTTGNLQASRVSLYSEPSEEETTPASILLQFLGLFQDIRVLDLADLELYRVIGTPDPELTKQLPRIHEIIWSYRGITEFICEYLDPTLPVVIRDSTFSAGFLNQRGTSGLDLYRPLPNVAHVFSWFGFKDQRFRVSSRQLSGLRSIELRTRVTFERRQYQNVRGGYELWNPDPVQVFVRGLQDTPASLRHTTLTIELYRGFEHIQGPMTISLDEAIMPRLKRMDWSSLQSHLDAKKTIWKTRIIFVTGYRTTLIRNLTDDSARGRINETSLDAEEFGEVLRKEIPILGSRNVSLVVKLGITGDLRLQDIVV